SSPPGRPTASPTPGRGTRSCSRAALTCCWWIRPPFPRPPAPPASSPTAPNRSKPMYVAVKGGERAIANAHALLAKEGRGDPGVPRIGQAAVAGQLAVLVARVMTEGSLYDPELAARAILQAQGDVLEAVTLVRSYRTTLPRFGYTLPVDTASLPPQRRISATFKDLPGGQQLGATFDYTHRLFTDRDAEAGGGTPRTPRGKSEACDAGPEIPEMPRVSDLLGASALIEPDHGPDPGDQGP